MKKLVILLVLLSGVGVILYCKSAKFKGIVHRWLDKTQNTKDYPVKLIRNKITKIINSMEESVKIGYIPMEWSNEIAHNLDTFKIERSEIIHRKNSPYYGVKIIPNIQEMGVIKVTGVSFHREGQDKLKKLYDDNIREIKLSLERDLENKHDPNAIRVVMKEEV